MLIPAFALDKTSSPYVDIVDFTSGQKSAVAALGQAQEAQAGAMVDLGKSVTGLGAAVADLGADWRKKDEARAEAEKKKQYEKEEAAKVARTQGEIAHKTAEMEWANKQGDASGASRAQGEIAHKTAEMEWAQENKVQEMAAQSQQERVAEQQSEATFKREQQSQSSDQSSEQAQPQESPELVAEKNLMKVNGQQTLNNVFSSRLGFNSDASTLMSKWKSSLQGPTVLDSIPGLRKTMDELKQKYIDAAPTEEIKAAVSNDLDSHVASYVADGTRKAIDVYEQYSRYLAEKTNQGYQQAAFEAGVKGDVNGVQNVLDKSSASLAAQAQTGVVVNPVSAEAVKRKGEVAMAASFLSGQLLNPITAMQAIADFEAGAYINKLDPETHDLMAHVVQIRKNELIIDNKRTQAESVQTAKESIQDTMKYLEDQAANAVATGNVTGDTGGALQRLRSLGGEHAAKADAYEASIITGQQIHSVIQGGVFLPFAQQRSRLNRLLPKEGDPDAALKIEAVSRGLDVLAEQEGNFRRDPAGFTWSRAENQVAQNSGDPKADPTRVINLSLKIQRDMGLKEHHLRVLPANESKRLLEQYRAADADGKVRFLQNLDAYGQYKDNVMEELALGSADQYASELLRSPDPRAGIAARKILDATPEKVKIAPSDEQASVKDMYEKSQTLSLMLKQAENMGKAGASVSNSARELALAGARMAATSNNPREAASYLDLAHTAVDEDEVALALVPKSMSKRDAVRGFINLRFQVTEDQLSDLKNVLVADHGENLGEMLFKERVRDIRHLGVWINDGDGYALYDPRTNKPVAIKGGKTLRVTDEQIKEAARPDPEPDIPAYAWGS